MKQVDANEWKEVAHPIQLCELPLLPSDIEAKKAIKFFHVKEMGLGTLDTAVVEIDGSLFWFQCPISQKNLGVIVYTRSFEKDLNLALKKLLKAFDLKKEELIWKAENLGRASWVLTRLDDNGNEIEMYHFHDERTAKAIKELYESKGHKQAYFIKNAT